MGKLLDIRNIENLKRETKGDRLVLAGGSFDILHSGHLEFLKKAKRLGDVLIVFLESDLKIRNLKGKGRPINSQRSRAAALSNLKTVDYLIMLDFMENDSDYEALVKKIEPDIIALTAEDKVFDWEKKSGIELKRIMEKKPDYSTTKIVEEMQK